MSEVFFATPGFTDGDNVFQFGGKGYFFGDPASPPTCVVQQSVTSLVTTTISQVATSGKWAFASSTAAQRLVAWAVDVDAAIKAYNLVAAG